MNQREKNRRQDFSLVIAIGYLWFIRRSISIVARSLCQRVAYAAAINTGKRRQC
jgi:hypothetical protein